MEIGRSTYPYVTTDAILISGAAKCSAPILGEPNVTKSHVAKAHMDV